MTVNGQLKPTKTMSSNNDIVMASGIPNKFQPTRSAHFICQGSGIDHWLLSIYSGDIHISRYGTTGYTNLTEGMWLVIDATYSI